MMDNPHIENSMRSSKHVGPAQIARRQGAGPNLLFLERSDVLKVRRGQFATLAHNVIGELLPFIEVAHSSALDCGNMYKYVRSAIGRLNEAKALL